MMMMIIIIITICDWQITRRDDTIQQLEGDLETSRKQLKDAIEEVKFQSQWAVVLQISEFIWWTHPFTYTYIFFSLERKTGSKSSSLQNFHPERAGRSCRRGLLFLVFTFFACLSPDLQQTYVWKPSVPSSLHFFSCLSLAFSFSC